MMGFGMGLGWLWMILLVVGLIVLAVAAAALLFPRHSRQAGSGEQVPSARQVLDLRYARGEINREEYELMKQDIAQV